MKRRVRRPTGPSDKDVIIMNLQTSMNLLADKLIEADFMVDGKNKEIDRLHAKVVAKDADIDQANSNYQNALSRFHNLSKKTRSTDSDRMGFDDAARSIIDLMMDSFTQGLLLAKDKLIKNGNTLTSTMVDLEITKHRKASVRDRGITSIIENAITRSDVTKDEYEGCDDEEYDYEDGGGEVYDVEGF